MANLNLGARPNIKGWLELAAIDFKVTDPGAVDKDAPVDMINLNVPLKMHLTFAITGNLKNDYNRIPWSVTFYADAVGVDVPYGELHWPLVDVVPTDLGNDTYEISYTIPSGLSHEAVYEFGAIARVPQRGINVYVEGLHVDVTPFP